jgi:parallel beta-helix repeat protein
VAEEGGILLGGANNIAYNNVVWGNGGGIGVAYTGAENNKVYNNTVFGNTYGGIGVDFASDTKIVNNISWGNGGPDLLDDTANGAVGTYLSSNLTSDPSFVDTANLDFHLLYTSQAINAGEDVGVTTDFDGNARDDGRPDIGAFEFGAPAPPPAPSSYVGCYTDDSSRALPTYLMYGGATVESCIAAAATGGFAYAGVQYGGHCFAGDTLAYDLVPDAECDMPCTADPSETCGGTWRNSIYSTGLGQAQ